MGAARRDCVEWDEVRITTRGRLVALAYDIDSSRKDSNSSAGSDGAEGFSHERSEREHLTCAAVATGMKCLPQSKVAFAKGCILHDSHAEVLAIRAFNRFLVDECAQLARSGLGSTSQWVRWRQREQAPVDFDHAAADGRQPFELEDGVGIHMYCSECPCGDASMELTMQQQADATPWSESPPSASDLLGRGHFNQLGIVRRKPARADAPPTLSKSCSDKLALKQVTSLLSSIVSQLIWPGNVYLSTLVLPESQIVPTAIERAWGMGGRMNPVTALEKNTTKRWEEAGYSFYPFSVEGTTRTFEYGKPTTKEDTAVPSNISALSTPYARQVLINGILQGYQQSDTRGLSSVSRLTMWWAVFHTAALAGEAAARAGERGEMVDLPYLHDVVSAVGERSYADAKVRCATREEVKRVVKEVALKGWRRNEGDDGWQLRGSAW